MSEPFRSQTHNNGTLPQAASPFNHDVDKFTSLFEPSEPILKPFKGVRTLRFLGITHGKNQFGKKTIRFNFRDTVTDVEVYRTVNATLTGRSYLVKLLAALIPSANNSKIAVLATPTNRLFEAINRQIGTLYKATCQPSKNGKYTDIIDFRIAKATDYLQPAKDFDDTEYQQEVEWIKAHES